MRFRLLTALLAAAALLALPAAAHAKVTVGISENSPAMFTHPLFGGLGAKHARVVMAYNVMTSGNHELARVTEYLNAARAAGVTPLVTFEHATGDASICNKRRNFRRAVCRLPSQRSYRSNVRKFFAAFPWVRVVAPWNEVNHFTQPTSRNPRAAAKFTNTVAKLCRRCTIVAADVLDSRNMVPWLKEFRRHARKPKIWGLHNYQDANNGTSDGTRELLKAVRGQIWLTETGGIRRLKPQPGSTGRGRRATLAGQAAAVGRVYRLARLSRRIARIYFYEWQAQPRNRWDSAFVNADGTLRPAYYALKRGLKNGVARRR